MNRRSFLSTLLGAAVALEAEPLIQKAFSFPSHLGRTPGLAFHKDAFAMDGLSMRLVRSWDVRNGLLVSKIDALWGWATITDEELREVACREVQFVEEPTWRQVG